MWRFRFRHRVSPIFLLHFQMGFPWTPVATWDHRAAAPLCMCPSIHMCTCKVWRYDKMYIYIYICITHVQNIGQTCVFHTCPGHLHFDFQIDPLNRLHGHASKRGQSRHSREVEVLLDGLGHIPHLLCGASGHSHLNYRQRSHSGILSVALTLCSCRKRGNINIYSLCWCRKVCWYSEYRSFGVSFMLANSKQATFKSKWSQSHVKWHPNGPWKRDAHVLDFQDLCSTKLKQDSEFCLFQSSYYPKIILKSSQSLWLTYLQET